MNNNRIRLTETQLRRVIKESVQIVLDEMYQQNGNMQQYLGGKYGQQHADQLMQNINQTIQKNPNATMVWDTYGDTRYTAEPIGGGKYNVFAQSQYGSKNCGVASDAQEIVRLFLN